VIPAIPVYFHHSQGELRIFKKNDETLTELVRAEMYDLLYPKHTDTAHKERIWKEVGQEMKQDGNTTNIYFIKIN
jgi:hypothetical protein